MDHEKICVWLGLPRGNWPPDHYTLLGLKPGEGDIACIEQQVHERLDKLRCYQLSHPDQATEAMNRLAQAFMCLSDPDAKKAYDQLKEAPSAPAQGKQVTASPAALAKPGSLPLAESPKENSVAAAVKQGIADDTAVGPKTQLDWRQVPPPVRAPASPVFGTEPESRQGQNGQSAPAAPTASVAAPAPPTPAPPAPVSQPADAVYAQATTSPEARRGLGTFEALVDRIDLTRRLLWGWEQAGKYLNRPKRRVTRLLDQSDLGRRLRDIALAMARFPRILGQPGQPGYRVVAMARLQMTADMFNMLDFPQREALAQDWVAGRVVLLAHRRFLLQEFKKLRRLNPMRRGIRAARAFLNDRPSGVFLLVVLAIWAVVAIYFFWW